MWCAMGVYMVEVVFIGFGVLISKTIGVWIFLGTNEDCSKGQMLKTANVHNAMLEEQI